MKSKEKKSKSSKNSQEETALDSLVTQKDSLTQPLSEASLPCTCVCAEHKKDSINSNLDLTAESKDATVKPRGIQWYGLGVSLLLLLPLVAHSAFNLAFSPVLTGSMKPKLNPGDILITKQVEASKLKVGEIVVLRDSESYALYSHRIISITSDKAFPNFLTIATKGDNNPTAEAHPVQINKFAGVPVGVGRVPWVGRIIVAFAVNKGKTIGYICILALIVMMVPNLFRKRKKKETLQ